MEAKFELIPLWNRDDFCLKSRLSWYIKIQVSIKILYSAKNKMINFNSIIDEKYNC
jgi:hypothetical protein